MIISTNRLEAFSDGIMAIAITIMVLDIKVEVASYQQHMTRAEWLSFARLLPHFLSYVLSFVMIGIMWVNHHHMYHAIRHVDGKLLWHNLHLLFWLTLMPFSTSMLGRAPLLRLSTSLYGFVLFMALLAFALSQRYAQRHSLLHMTKKEELNMTLRKLNKRMRAKTYIGMIMYFISIPLSFVSVYLTYACFAVPPVLSFLPEGVDDKGLSKFLFDSFERDKMK